MHDKGKVRSSIRLDLSTDAVVELGRHGAAPARGDGNKVSREERGALPGARAREGLPHVDKLTLHSLSAGNACLGGG